MNPEIIIGTCIYNRTSTLKNFINSIHETTKIPYKLVLVFNYDDLFTIRDIEEACSFLHPENEDSIEWEITKNDGLRSFNIPIKYANKYNTPVLLCNDDVQFPNNWTDKLLNVGDKALRGRFAFEDKGEWVDINKFKIGMVGPCYNYAGCMRHQQYRNKTGYCQYDFCVGHAQLITRNALDKGFNFDEKYCTRFGPFDVYSSKWMQLNELNVYVSNDCIFRLEAQETQNKYHCGDPDKFSWTKKDWSIMERNMETMQKEIFNKFGENRWYF